MLEKMKEFCGKHDMVLWIAIGAGAGLGLYKLGYNTAVRRGNIGLNACFLAKPELKPMLEDAIKTVEGSVGKVK